jgi:phosphoserine phosphatase
MFADYVLNKPESDVSEQVRAVAEELISIKKASDIPSYMEEKHIKAHAQAFAGMTIKDYLGVVNTYKSTKAEGFSGMTRGEAFYLPMLEVVDYLIKNNFIVYICSGTNRFTVRGLIDGVIDIPARQVIGTDFTIAASGQGDEKDMDYNYTEKDKLLMGDEVITKNVKMSKVAQLEQELGQKPVLVFGNSTGDVPMSIYADTDNEYLTQVFFILCDDTEREFCNLSKAEKVASICAEYGWQTISMKNDWKTIYGKNVEIVKNF